MTSSWPHRLAVLLVVFTFPLIWVGGLVTTYDAGMAVPDWPTTYGYNLFLYPWQSWVSGPWDLFIEHGHRLLGALVGLLTISLLVTVSYQDNRPWVSWAAVATLAAVIFQGSLGGARVLLDDRQLAMVHGCVGPLFLGLCTAMAVWTSRLWRGSTPRQGHERAGTLQRLAAAILALSVLQLVLGANLRHLPVWASPGAFRLLVMGHLLVAGIIVIHVLWLSGVVWRHFAATAALRRPAVGLVVLTCLQVLLGAGTWVAKFAWPAWPALMERSPVTAAYTVQANGVVPAMVVTAHVATGALILAVAMMMMLRSLRLLRSASVVSKADKCAVNEAVRGELVA